MKALLQISMLCLAWSSGTFSVIAAEQEAPRITVPILVYHRFGAAVTDDMTITDDTFAWQLRYLKEHGYSVVPLHQLVKYFQGAAAPPPLKSIVITADDGHRSVYTDMLPLVRQYGIHTTLFIYPSAISNAAYAMTWPQLAELIDTGLFDIQSHTYWHPNFHKDKARLTTHEYDAFVHMQLARSKQVLERHLAMQVDLLAWPFGIYDNELMSTARQDGYTAALSIDRRPATESDSLMALPRFLITNDDRGPAFIRLLSNPGSGRERPATDTSASGAR